MIELSMPLRDGWIALGARNLPCARQRHRAPNAQKSSMTCCVRLMQVNVDQDNPLDDVGPFLLLVQESPQYTPAVLIPLEMDW
jgi:hypothetical protein